MRFKGFISEGSEKALTDFMETASCIGVICGDTLSNELKKFVDTKHKKDEPLDEVSSLLKRVQDICGSGPYDWNKAGVSYIHGITIDNPRKVNVLFNLVIGMNDFMRGEVDKIIKTKPYFIHNNIQNYYKKEKEIFGKIPFTKDNTADIIISTHNHHDTLKGMTAGTNADKSLKYVETPDGIVFIQVSLKKNAAEAQLGKITTMVKGLYDIDKTSDIVNMFTNDPERPTLTSEGVIWDKVKSFVSHITSLARGVFQKLVHMFGKVNKKHLSQFEKGMGINEEMMSGSGKALTSSNEALVVSVISNPARATSLVNNEIKKLQEMVRSTPIPVKADSVGSFSIKTPEDAFHLVSNYLTVKAIQEMVSDANNLQKNISRMVGEMYFGGTKLPLWKVFGYFGKKSWHYMGTLEVSMAKRESLPSIDVMGVRMNKGTGSYTITIYMLEDVDERGREYVMLRTGTNSSSTPTFIIEGTKPFGPVPMEKPLVEVM